MWMAAKCLVGEAEIPSVEDIQRRAIDLKFSANGDNFLFIGTRSVLRRFFER